MNICYYGGMKSIVMVCVQKARSLSLEEWGMIVFGASFLIGVWYAFPMVNTITDVWAFGGGVLRAMEAHTLLPLGGDVLYGTISFYENYLFMAIALGVGFIVTGFDMGAVKTAFILNPSYSLLVPRIVSALTAMVFLFAVYRFLRSIVQERWWRLALLALLFGNVITIFLARSGKMWILSMTLVTISFIFLHRSLSKEREQGIPGRYAFISIITTALATANFAFAALFFVCVPIIFFAFPKTWAVFRRLAYMTLAGFGVVFAVFLLNAENIIGQVSGFLPDFLTSGAKSVLVPTEGTLSLFESVLLKTRHSIEAFPLLLLALIPAIRAGVRDRTLAFLAAFYGILYMSVLVFIFRADHDIALNVRQVFPFGIFLTFFLAAFHPPRKCISVTLLSVSVLLYLYTVVLLSVPATYNNAYKYVVKNYGNADIRIEEHIFEFMLPMNKASYELFADSACASTCRYRRSLDTDIDFRPTVITDETDPLLVRDAPPDLIITEHAISGCTPLARFGNPVPDNEVFDIDINLGRMLIPSFYKLGQLGKNLYVYDSATCAEI